MRCTTHQNLKTISYQLRQDSRFPTRLSYVLQEVSEPPEVYVASISASFALASSTMLLKNSPVFPLNLITSS